MTAAAAVGRRYARALMDVATTQGVDLGVLGEEIVAWANLVETHAEAREALTSPSVPVERRKAAAEALAERVKSSPLFRRVMALLVERGRLEVLPALAAAYRDLWNERRGVTAAEVITAVPLDKGQESALGAALATRAGGEVEITSRVDPAIGGGVVVRMGGRTYDGSVRARLLALRAHLAGRG
ncbi:MAG TPA: ATP synthase F1 subunit delta [Vicinamibacteria bacterium]|nr:ATP synthase F1 subunit delta [Vicinamibacteria bacterium]